MLVMVAGRAPAGMLRLVALRGPVTISLTSGMSGPAGKFPEMVTVRFPPVCGGQVLGSEQTTDEMAAHLARAATAAGRTLGHG